ncbi:hypothetical protein [Jatrophihabitans fulvus]
MAVTAKRVAVAAAVAATLAGGMAVGADAAGASAGARPTATYQVYANQAVGGGPWALRPGVAKIHVVGKGRLFQLLRSRKGAGEKKLIADFATFNQGKPIPLERDFQLMGGTTPGHSMWVHLVPGTYYALNPQQQSLSAPKIKKIVVRNADWNAPVPAASTIVAIKSHSFSLKPAGIPRSGVLRFKNDANQSHFVEMIRMRPGKTHYDVAKALRNQEPFPKVFYGGKTDDISTGAISPGRTMLQTYAGKPGKWAILCFYPDRMTGMPHAFMGMYRVITLR